MTSGARRRRYDYAATIRILTTTTQDGQEHLGRRVWLVELEAGQGIFLLTVITGCCDVYIIRDGEGTVHVYFVCTSR